MSLSLTSLIERTSDATNNGQMHFGQVVSVLANAGVESYHVDYRTNSNVIAF